MEAAKTALSMRTALDSSAMVRHFQAQLPTAISQCLIHQVWPQKDGTFFIAYELLGEEATCSEGLLLTGQLFQNGAAEEAYKEARLQGEPVAYLSSLNMVLWPFPADTRLAHLDLAGCGTVMADVFDWALYKLIGKVQVCQAQLVSYRPGRRATFRYRLELGTGRRQVLYGKIYRSNQGHETFNLLRSLWKGPLASKADGVTIPNPVAYVPEFRMLIQEGVAGLLLFHLLKDNRLAHHFEQAGKALAKVHKLDYPDLQVHTSEEELAVVDRWIKAATAFFPRLAGPLRKLRKALRRWEKEATPPPLVSGHRDFYDRQVLLAEPQVTLLDFDAFAKVEPALDIGNFLAHLTLRNLQSLTSAKLAEKAERTFLRAYEASRGSVDPDRVAFYRATSLLRLSCIYALRPRWSPVVRPLLQETERALQCLQSKVYLRNTQCKLPKTSEASLPLANAGGGRSRKCRGGG